MGYSIKFRAVQHRIEIFISFSHGFAKQPDSFTKDGSQRRCNYSLSIVLVFFAERFARNDVAAGKPAIEIDVLAAR